MKPTMTDEWWTPDPMFDEKTAPRRILAENEETVIYSDGSRKTKECTKAQFENWRKKFGCTKDRYAKRA